MLDLPPWINTQNNIYTPWFKAASKLKNIFPHNFEHEILSPYVVIDCRSFSVIKGYLVMYVKKDFACIFVVDILII